MPRSLTLHIGTPKSGTTHLQAVLQAGRSELSRRGILYPGAGYLPKDGFNQQPAIYALAGPTIGWITDHVRANATSQLDQLAGEVCVHPGRTVVSAESLAFFEASAARALLDRLQYSPEQVHVVITARDMGRLLPSIWQQNVKNGSTQALTPYLESVAELRGRPGMPLWTAFGLPGLVRRWADVVGMQRMTLVTAPVRRDPPDALWQRFATAADLPSELFAAAQNRELAVDNLSLSPSQAEIVRQLNIILDADGYDRDAQQVLRTRLLRIWMNRPSPTTRRLAVPEHLRDTVRSWADEDVAQLSADGVRVVGALSDLIPGWPPQPDPMTDVTVDPDTARDVLTLLEDALPKPASRPEARGWRSVLGSVRALRSRRDDSAGPMRVAQRVVDVSTESTTTSTTTRTANRQPR